MLSIIIPTLNEERYLPLLLESLKKQSFSDYEIIIADAGSEDATLEIAKRYNCIIVPGGSPSKGRNQGAKLAKNRLLLFLDADTFLSSDFLENSLEEFKKRSLKLASYCLVINKDKSLFSFLSNACYNVPIMMTEKVFPHAATGILIEKDLFEKLKGFDEEIKLAEDHDLARRAKKITADYGILRSVKIFTSDRRFRRDGWIKTSLKYLLCEFHLIFLGPIKSDVFKYRFNHYKKDQKKQRP